MPNPPPLPLARIKALQDICRNVPEVVRMAQEIERLRGIEYAAQEVAALTWQTSISEREHYARIDAMDRLRAALQPAPEAAGEQG